MWILSFQSMIVEAVNRVLLVNNFLSQTRLLCALHTRRCFLEDGLRCCVILSANFTFLRTYQY